MMTENSIHIDRAHWPDQAAAIREIRNQVFVREQGVPVELEWDGEDSAALHLLARDVNEQPIATARLLADGQIGRMAVLPAWRHRGIGSALLARLLELVTALDYPTPFLHAQEQAVGFYLKQGFEPTGEPFMDAGIPHLQMVYRSPRTAR